MAAAPSPGFGSLLRRHRVAAGLSQEGLAERAGLSVRGISDLERGARATPRPETVRLLAEALGLEEGERTALIAAAHPELGAARTRSAGPPAVPPWGADVAAVGAGPGRAWGPLPVPPTGLVGREAEVAGLRPLLGREDVRLVTLTGPGGVGKTRLALAAAAEAAGEGRFADGVAFVDLAPVGDPEHVAAAVAGAVGVRQVGERPLPDALRAALAERRLLLVLDNFEHVLGAAPLVADLLAGCPNLAVLATSRERLRLRGEREVAVEPLAVEESRSRGVEESGEGGGSPTPDPNSGTRPLSPAVELFAARAEEVRPGFALDGVNGPAVEEICRRLEGLPLAIELAAGRVKALPPAALAERLERRLPVLTDGPRDLPDRQRTLRATIAWSHDLLTPEEQALFRRLAVFAGGCTLAAADAVRRGVVKARSREDDLARDSATSRLLDHVASLVDKHLLRQVDGPGGEPRYRMPETVREFGLERLAASGEEGKVRRRHAAWCLDLAERADPDVLRLVDHHEWLPRLEAERDNLRAALAWAQETGAGETLLRLAGALTMLWYLRGPLDEGRRWLDAALARGTQGATPAYARALCGAGFLALFQGDMGGAEEFLAAALDLYRALGDRFWTAYALLLLGMAAEKVGDYDRAAPLLAEARVLFDGSTEPALVATTVYHQGVVTWGGDDREGAIVQLGEALRLARAAEAPFVVGWVLERLALVACELAEHARAAALFGECLAMDRAAGPGTWVGDVVAGLAVLAEGTGRAELAARLFGASDALQVTFGWATRLPERASYERAAEAARAALGEEAFATARAGGRALTPEAAFAEGRALVAAVAGPAA